MAGALGEVGVPQPVDEHHADAGRVGEPEQGLRVVAAGHSTAPSAPATAGRTRPRHGCSCPAPRAGRPRAWRARADRAVRRRRLEVGHRARALAADSCRANAVAARTESRPSAAALTRTTTSSARGCRSGRGRRRSWGRRTWPAPGPPGRPAPANHQGEPCAGLPRSCFSGSGTTWVSATDVAPPAAPPRSWPTRMPTGARSRPGGRRRGRRSAAWASAPAR